MFLGYHSSLVWHSFFALVILLRPFIKLERSQVAQSMALQGCLLSCKIWCFLVSVFKSIAKRDNFTGVWNLVITLAAALYGFRSGKLNLAWIYDNYLPLLTAAVGFSFALSLALWLASYRRQVSHSNLSSTDIWSDRQYCDYWPWSAGF